MSEDSLNTEKMTGLGKQVNGEDKNKANRTQEYWENRPEIYLMRYDDFAKEYDECIKIAQVKESKGNLDPHHPNYIPMTEEEINLHARDWRGFSKQRGFTDYDIAEYARWHKISGQTDNLEYAINDPWRRVLPDWEKQLYVKHIKKALESEIKVPQEIIQDFQIVKNELDNFRPNFRIQSTNENQISDNIPSDTDINWGNDNDWN